MMFICDIMLGRLSRYLRMLGLDAPCASSPASTDAWGHTGPQPYFFTKRLKAPRYERTVYIRSDRVMEQLLEIRPIIAPHVMPGAVMSRCIECNVPLVVTTREDVEHHVPEYIYHHYAEFKQCPSCKKVYWSGSHTENMKKWIDTITK